MQICNASRRIFIELINVPFLKQSGTGEQFHTAVALAQERESTPLNAGKLLAVLCAMARSKGGLAFGRQSP
ncbi:hypothetical protein [Bradyrhizobium sp. CCBAU 11357]|uniref:hypothetical protein n=1 Tax=Bradyrhizobium sp. CCBAU 11357 TaxID=1630808 RepID=UPI0023032E96|nr:hypothetical protein [Bradyrhizobium sp. CCBAU 11357]MDA9499460.1 hypothetical protein [Bradyrhizobium sp. CCBAU 11357]